MFYSGRPVWKRARFENALHGTRAQPRGGFTQTFGDVTSDWQPADRSRGLVLPGALRPGCAAAHPAYYSPGGHDDLFAKCRAAPAAQLRTPPAYSRPQTYVLTTPLQTLRSPTPLNHGFPSPPRRGYRPAGVRRAQAPDAPPGAAPGRHAWDEPTGFPDLTAPPLQRPSLWPGLLRSRRQHTPPFCCIPIRCCLFHVPRHG